MAPVGKIDMKKEYGSCRYSAWPITCQWLVVTRQKQPHLKGRLLHEKVRQRGGIVDVTRENNGDRDGV